MLQWAIVDGDTLLRSEVSNNNCVLSTENKHKQKKYYSILNTKKH